MNPIRIASLLVLASIASLPSAARAETVVANCTGMLDFDIYRIDTELPVQEIEGLGEATVVVEDDIIVATGGFGEYRFDRKVGTLYVDGRDSGIYCTWSRPAG